MAVHQPGFQSPLLKMPVSLEGSIYFNIAFRSMLAALHPISCACAFK